MFYEDEIEAEKRVLLYKHVYMYSMKLTSM